MGTIEVWAVPAEDEDNRFWGDRKGQTPGGVVLPPPRLELAQVPGELLRANITTLISEFQTLSPEPSPSSKFELDEIELSLVVTTKGGVQLITKLEAGAEASIKVKLKRRQPAP